MEEFFEKKTSQGSRRVYVDKLEQEVLKNQIF
jgi:hypothetical protein